MKNHNTAIQIAPATVDFHGSPLIVITGQNGEHLVAMKPICENIGLDWDAQRQRIKRDEVLSTCTVMMTVQMLGDDQSREVTCLPLEYLNGWLFGIDIKRCREEIRPILIQYKRECYSALAAYFQQGEAINPRKPKKPKALPNGLTTEQQEAIKGLVKARVDLLPQDKRAKAAVKCWSALKNTFGCTYKKIDPNQFTDAVSLVARLELEGEFLGKEPTINPTLNELDLAMLYVFCIDTLELIHVGEEVKPIFDVLRPVKLINVPTCLSECREVVAHLHERFGPQMEQAARNRGAFDGRRNLAAAGDPSQPIWIPRRAQGIRG
ncbi:P22-like antirepressor protein [Azomonas agilis]|uniref:P22-like antirepressor protein n=1 Tax=Azomonas agilis TaxID=116849 RepID=A0A562HYZ1_9GAMM|nr:phage antirepressor N-terminal domain-containing protein [Azomonas agilis]TWH63816.1 P22-like antirepressor protein [Azomonas agilis]